MKAEFNENSVLVYFEECIVFTNFSSKSLDSKRVYVNPFLRTFVKTDYRSFPVCVQFDTTNAGLKQLEKSLKNLDFKEKSWKEFSTFGREDYTNTLLMLKDYTDNQEEENNEIWFAYNSEDWGNGSASAEKALEYALDHDLKALYVIDSKNSTLLDVIDVL